MKLSPSVVGLLLTLVVLALGEAQPALSQFPSEGNVVVLPQSISMLYGNDFTLDVQAQGVLNMTWLSFHMNFTNFVNLIRLDSYTLASGWLNGGGLQEKPGYWGFSAGRAAFNGTSTVFTVTFHCLAGGDSSIVIEDADWIKYWGGSPYYVNFVQLGMATVSQVLPSTVTATSNVTTTSTFTTVSTTTTTASSVSTTISQTTAIVTNWGYATLSGTTTTTSVLTSVLTSVVSSVSTTGGPTVTSTLTSTETATVTRSVTASGTTTSTVTSVSTVASPMTVTETTTSVESFEPPSLPSRCVIATAAYGSELAPDVAYMRYVRDELIGSAPLGGTLVAVFNAFYYSWSPALAEWIAESTLVTAIFRLLLLALVGIVRVTALVFTATAHTTGQTNVASLFAFLAAAIMTITVYVLLPIMAAAKSRQAIRGLRTRFRLWVRQRDT